MLIKSEKAEQGNMVLDIRGRWVTEVLVAKMRELEKKSTKTFNTKFTVGYLERGTLNNEIFITFPVDARVSDVEEVVDWINVCLITSIGTAFTPIDVNPYKVDYTKDTDSLTLALEIAKETDCRFNAGEWMRPYQFRPSNNVQYNKITELLDLFGMHYN